MDLPHTEDGSRMDALDSLSTARTVTPWPERLSKPVASDPFFYGNTGKDVPIVIDFGSQRLRAGFSDQSDPFLDMPSVYSRYKIERVMGEEEEELVMHTYAGNDVMLLPPAAKKVTPFDLNIPYHLDGVEYIFDHVFQRLLTKNRPGSFAADSEDESDTDEESDEEFAPSTKKRKMTHGTAVGSRRHSDTVPFYDTSIVHPLMITEAPFIPGYSRAQLIQLAFECYGSSKLCFGIDALFSLLYDHHNNYAGCRVTNTFSQPENEGPQNADILFDFVVPPSGLEHREGSSSMSDSINYPIDALVVSSGFETTHVLPVVDGNLDNHGVVRLNVGGHHATELLNKSIHMHYPQHKASWAKLQASFPGSGPGYGAAESLKEQECFLATPDYLTFLRDIQHGNIDSTFVRYLQFSYEPSPIVTITEDERREREARRLENAERLREMSKRKKEEKLIDKANRLDVLEELFDARVKLSNQDFHAKLIEAQIDEEDWMNAALGGPRDCVVQEISEIRKYLERSVDDAILAERQAPAWKGWTLEQKLESQIAKFPLTVVPDNDLSEEELRIKKAHLKVRAMCDIKIRRSHERDLEKARKASTIENASSAAVQTSNSKQVKLAEEIDLEDDGGVTTKEVVEIHLDESKDLMVFGLDELQSQRKAIWNRLQRRQAALRERKSELKNASDAANKATVSDLVNFAPASGGVGMSGPGVGTTSINGIGSIANAIGARSSRAKKSAMLMYSAAADVRLDLDEAGLERMALHRADNADMASVVATQRVGELTSLVEAQNASVNADKSLLAKVDDEILSRLDPQILRQREAESYQLSMGIDRIRCPEILFQPSIVGIEQQGITEVIHSVLTRLGAAESALSSTRLPTSISIDRRASLLQNVYLTGGNCSFPRMTQRLFTGLAADLPVGSSLRVIQSSSPSLNAWRGAALFSNDPLNRQHHFVDQEVYLEEGADRLHARFMSHFASNRP